jgi:hypothetical protein
MKVILGGDTHGDRNQVRWLLDKAIKHDAAGVFVLGDFGIFCHIDAGAFTAGVAVDAARKGLKIWFLPGNHENYDLLERVEAEHPRDDDGFVIYHDGLSSLLYSPRGHRWSWDGVSFLSLGGAYSVDKDWRIAADGMSVTHAESVARRGHSLNAKDEYVLQHPHYRWWPQEQITDEQAASAAAGAPVDVMLAHDKPIAAHLDWNRKDIPEAEHNQRRLQRVVDAVKPRLYLHGHFHYAYTDWLLKTMTSVCGLDCDPEASKGSGGSGDRKLSWGVLDLDEGSYGFTRQLADGTEKRWAFIPYETRVLNEDEGDSAPQ